MKIKNLLIMLLASPVFADCSGMGWNGATSCTDTINFMSVVGIGLILGGVVLIYIAFKEGST